ncbi:Structural maintenance of chromosomes protein 1 [Rhodotorula toruloides]
MQFACGPAPVCDSMQIARHVCYDRVEEVKGAQAAAISKDQAVENLRRREAELRGKLADVFKNRPKASAEEQLINDETRLKADLRVVRDDLSSTESGVVTCR